MHVCGGSSGEPRVQTGSENVFWNYETSSVFNNAKKCKIMYIFVCLLNLTSSLSSYSGYLLFGEHFTYFFIYTYMGYLLSGEYFTYFLPKLTRDIYFLVSILFHVNLNGISAFCALSPRKVDCNGPPNLLSCTHYHHVPCR